MTIMVTILLVILLVAITRLLSTAGSKEYWRGRCDGWKACENMVLDRASEHKDYSRDEVWEDLIQ